MMMVTVLLQRLPKNYRAKMCSQYVLLVMQRRGPCGPFVCEVDREKAIGKRWSRVLFFALSPFWVTTQKDKQDTDTHSFEAIKGRNADDNITFAKGP